MRTTIQTTRNNVTDCSISQSCGALQDAEDEFQETMVQACYRMVSAVRDARSRMMDAFDEMERAGAAEAVPVLVKSNY